jgi:hypothetical protein
MMNVILDWTYMMNVILDIGVVCKKIDIYVQIFNWKKYS